MTQNEISYRTQIRRLSRAIESYSGDQTASFLSDLYTITDRYGVNVPRENMGRIIRNKRVGYEWTQAKLADDLGIKPAYLSELETNKKTPSITLAKEIEHALDLPEGSISCFASNLSSRPRKA